ncbi:hypothetical protein CLO05_15970 [Listeria monocytogenes]|nr:hypothetical protein [Listeria monocytogenes]EAE8031234.1 hypothetical protein [Listeria monocytogenes]EAE8492057.1 hypothetical protein [Listeria monocytogenes]EAE9317855.1 hypothetical protein [Listeria monocytogenes]EAF2184401.1 hypothetical protein [Listeria monocytogenes]
MTENEMVNVGEQNKYYHYKQSANSLFNFMPKKRFLIESIQKSSLFPRYVEENVEYLGVMFGGEKIKKVLFPMLCFCDINLHRLPFHVEGNEENEGYGKYGIGLDKEWCQQKGLQPVSYLNENSSTSKLLQAAVNRSFEIVHKGIDFDSSIEAFLDYSITQLAFSKPLMGSMKKGEDEVYKNFHDEKEWRYLPNLDHTDMPPFKNDVNNPDLQNSFMNNQLSETLKSTEGVPLMLEMNAINYIFVHTVEDRDEIINVLKERFNEDDALKMATKIVIYDQIVKDW